MLMVALSFIGIQKFVFLFARLWEITPWSLVLQFAFQFRCSNFAWVNSYFKSSFFFGRFCFLDNRSDRCSTVRYMYVERHVDIHFLVTNKICSLSTLNMIKLPTTIDSVLFVTLVWVKTNFIFSCIVQSIQSQGKNSTIKSNTILSILISCLPRNY